MGVRFVYADRDVDGLVAAALLGTPFRPVARRHVAHIGEPGGAPIGFVEVYPRRVRGGMVVLDHHRPPRSIYGGPWRWGMPYAVLPSGRLAVGRCIAWSTVSALPCLFRDIPELGELFPRYVEPPLELARLVDSIDNMVPPPMAALKWLGADILVSSPEEAVLLYAKAPRPWLFVEPHLALLDEGLRLDMLRDALLRWLIVASRRPEPPRPHVLEVEGYPLLVPRSREEREGINYHLFRMQRGYGLVGAVRPAGGGGGGYVVSVRSSKDVLDLLERLGGGGRPSLSGVYIGAYPASSIEEAVEKFRWIARRVRERLPEPRGLPA